MENNKNNIPEEEEKKKNKDIEIVTGDGSDLNISHVYDQAFKWIEKELDYQLWLNNHIKSVVNIMITHKNVLYEKYSDIYRSGGYNNPSEEYKKIFSIVYKEYEKSRK